MLKKVIFPLCDILVVLFLCFACKSGGSVSARGLAVE